MGGATATSTGGAATGGETAAGGTSATGGESATGGATTGGESATGGATTGGEPATGGAATGGEAATGGAATGGEAATGGAATGGTSSVPPKALLKYDFEEGTGTTTADPTNNNVGTLSAGVLWSASGRNGKAVSYTTADSSISMPDGVLKDAHAVTISAWVKLTASAAENRLFYFGAMDATSYLTLTLNNSATPAGISLRFKGETSSEVALTTPTQLPVGVWKHVAVTLSSTGASMYIDGKVVAHSSLAIDPSTLGSGTKNFVGTSPTGQVLNGLIDEFYVYNYELPVADASADADIRRLAWPKTDYSVYHLDEAAGTSTVDSSDRGINGTLTGTTWETAKIPSPFGTAVMLTNNPTATPALQYVDLGDGIFKDCTTSITISAWVQHTTNTTAAPVVEFGQDSTHYTNVTTYVTASPAGVGLSFYFINGTSSSFILNPKGSFYPTGQWSHIAVVRGDMPVTGGAGKYAAVFVNGELKSSTTDTKRGANFWPTTTLNFIGKSQFDTTAGFNGAIDEVLVACRQYTADEIAQLAYKP